MTVAKTSRKSTIKTEVAVRSLYDSRLVYRGAVTGKEYRWSGAGVVTMVLVEDVSALLEKRIGERACCGASQQSTKVFELA